MKTYSPDKLLFFPYFIQAKLNGVYAELGTDGLFRSKTGKFFPAVQKARCKIVSATGFIYCGEFYYHGWSLQQVISAVTPEEPNELTKIVGYHIYDCYLPGEDLPQYERLKNLPYPYGVDTYEIASVKQGTSYYNGFLSQGYEGAVYRPYYYGELLKRKPFKDTEFLCTGVVEGIGKRKNCVGALILKTKDGHTFKCGGGQVSYKFLKELLDKPPIGKMVTVRYQHTSDDGIPLCSQFICVRDFD